MFNAQLKYIICNLCVPVRCRLPVSPDTATVSIVSLALLWSPFLEISCRQMLLLRKERNTTNKYNEFCAIMKLQIMIMQRER